MTETPKTYTIELKEAELKGLIILLNRSQITGQEAESVVYMKQLLSKPLIEEKKE